MVQNHIHSTFQTYVISQLIDLFYCVYTYISYLMCVMFLLSSFEEPNSSEIEVDDSEQELLRLLK